MLGLFIESLLRYPKNYIFIQKIIGANRLRGKCIELIKPSSNDCILDIGCGPAQILEYLPKVKRYYGFDTENRYIDYAKNNYSTRGEFFACEFNENFVQSNKLKPVDKVFLMGILHHISDAAAKNLFEVIYKVLTPTGSVVSVDPCFIPGQSSISRFVAKSDRGKYVRNKDGYLSLVADLFEEIDTKVIKNTCRIPSVELIMHLKKPK